VLTPLTLDLPESLDLLLLLLVLIDLPLLRLFSLPLPPTGVLDLLVLLFFGLLSIEPLYLVVSTD
jgi:hypothetical protein